MILFMHSTKRPRRLLLTALVLATLLVTGLAASWLTGCASVDLQCGVRADYPNATPLAQPGSVQLHWDYRTAPSNPEAYGDADCWQGSTGRVCNLRLRESPPTQNDVCAMARLGHEVGHAMKANH